MLTPRRRIALSLSATIALVTAGVFTAISAHAAVACQVSYSVSSQWPGGFTANINLNNLGDPVNGWTVRWSFAAGQTVTQGWNATYTQSGANVSAANASYNASIGTGGTVSFGFNGSWNNSSNPAPTNFSLNNTPCNG